MLTLISATWATSAGAAGAMAAGWRSNCSSADLVLSLQNPEQLSVAFDELDTPFHLCTLKYKKRPNDFWNVFDLADSNLLSGRSIEEGLRLYRRGIDLVPTIERKDALTTVAKPIKELRALGVFKEGVLQGVTRALHLLDGAIREVPPVSAK
jgi:hypothetical protein